ncbi:MAG: ATP-binding protein [Comamonadaceae bacterium]|nr:ATP-binding protein [Comamonadaceae bacterium]
MDLAAVVRLACENLKGRVDAREHALRLALPAEPLEVDGDPVRLEQVVANLVSNAVKYTPAHGRLEVRLERDGDEAVLTVSDNGVGMAPRLVRDVFDLFVRGEGSAQMDIGGLGLGLAIVKRIVELHGGTVRAESDGPAQGRAGSSCDCPNPAPPQRWV